MVKTMYEELIGELRTRAEFLNSVRGENEDSVRMVRAADAIEELQRKEKFHAFLWNTIQPNEMEAYLSMYNAGNEKVES